MSGEEQQYNFIIYKIIILNGNKCVMYSESTKFLGLWMYEKLKWSIHIQMLLGKLGKVSLAIRMASQIMHLETTHSLYYAYFHSSLTSGIIFWGNSPKAKQVFMLQKRTIRIMMKVNYNVQL